MSSRLLSMKFMQRAAASSAGNDRDSAADNPNKKKRKLESSKSDLKAAQEALAVEEAKRDRAKQYNQDAQETRWVLSFKDEPATPGKNKVPVVLSTGYANIDYSNGESDREDQNPQSATGRMSFGKFNREVKASQQHNSPNASRGSSESGENDDITKNGGTNWSRAQNSALKRSRKGRESDEAVTACQEQSKPDKKVKLSKLTSISGGRGGKPQDNIECYQCGGSGHIAKQCPNKKGKRKG